MVGKKNGWAFREFRGYSQIQLAELSGLLNLLVPLNARYEMHGCRR